MVERGGVRVDWLGGRDGMMEDGMEGERRRGGDEWGRSGEDEDKSEDERRRKKVRRGMMLMKGKEEQEKDAADNAEENMLELRLSLAVARSVPSPQQQQQLQQSAAPPGSFVVHQLQNNHSHNQNSSNQHRLQQQLATSVGGLEQSPVKPRMPRSSSPIENHTDSLSRANLTASLKHLVSQQQQHPVKVKSGSRIPGLAGSTAIRLQPLQYGVSPVPQLHRPQPPPLLRSSSFLQDGPDSEVVHFQGIGRLNPTAQQPSPSLVGQVGQLRQQQQQQSSLFNHNQSHESLFPKGYPLQNNNQPRLSSHRIFSRTTLAGFPQQQSGKELLTQQERHHLGSIAQSVVLPSSPSGRIFGNSSYSPHDISPQAVNLPVTGPQLQAFLQNHSSNAVSVASHRQTQPPSSQSGVAALGNNLSAFSVVRPSISGTIPPSIGDIPPRERSGDAHVMVSVCDRKVKLTSESDATPLYSLCRRWVRNDVLRRDQSVIWDCPPLPRPSPAAETGTNKTEPEENCKKEEIVNVSQKNWAEYIESMAEEDLLQHHVVHFKNVRKRFRDNRAQRIERFMPRLALLLPVSAENCKQ